MENIFCGYYDEEMEQDVPLQPNISEAITFFKDFIWENKNSESAMKILFLQALGDNEASLQISCLEKKLWCISTSVSIRRRFLGPFLKRNTFKVFIDKNEGGTENIIRKFYESSPNEFAEFLKSSES
ncbi:hypothetical protein CWC16_04360 [Pseudoalteromonas sp. S3776]|uniref:hypothetical protein n=1 Tax=Pseudoalteromonas sp. S3776 TaxID=579544 RepID=UPI001108B3EA|nr:hypothetical protein [Pseudoalteromonas sp. S3776]TMO81250.1 hypothetical protein CWC16_04360 [Pseudoalteromonas sp. S3776]